MDRDGKKYNFFKSSAVFSTERDKFRKTFPVFKSRTRRPFTKHEL